MANVPESTSFDAGIYQLETTDPVQGGTAGVSNTQAKGLANRTNYLKVHMDAAETAIAGINTALATAPATQAAGDEDQSIATTAFVHRNSGGTATVDCTGGAPVTPDSDHWGCATLILTGAITANINLILPARADRWLVVNRTSGLFQITCKTPSGSGVKVAQGRQKSIWGDGTNIYDGETDLSTRGRTITSATTLAAGDKVYVDQSGGAFATTLPLNPSEGDELEVIGNFGTSSHTVQRNGQTIRDKDGVAQAADMVLNRNHVRAKFGFYNGSWQV